MRELFSDFLRKEGKKEKTIKEYIYALSSRIESFAKKYKHDFKSMFELSSSEAEGLMSNLEKDTSFIDYIKKSNNVHLSAFNKYRDFLAKRQMQSTTKRSKEAIEVAPEGEMYLCHYNEYQRNKEIRDVVAKRDNYTCCVCGMNFADFYGEDGLGFIEVHHLNPINEGSRETKLEDLVSVCSNCHSMLHKKTPPLTPEMLKAKILNFIFFIIFPISIYAQDIEVKKFELLEKDQTAVTSPKKDINGADCALVIVQSLKKGMEFEGWVVGDVDYKEDCYWVYMANGSKHLKLKHTNYQTKDVIFGEYGINSLKSSATYMLNITDDVNDIVNKVYSLGWNLNKMDVPDNVKTFIRMAATRGDAKAQVAMAQLSLEGHVNVQGGLVNHRGLFWINKLLAAGDSTCLEDMPGELMYAYAFQSFGELSSDTSLGRFDAQKERSVYTKISEYLIKACNKGFIQAGNHLFGHYPMSNGLPQYSKDIIRCCEDSSKVGNISAMVCLGNIYEKGIGEKVDLAKAEKWYRRLYEYNPWGSHDLCRIYGNKLFPIGKEHMAFLQNQADKGNLEALFQLGYMYEEGRNFTQSEEKALQLYNKCGRHKEALYRAAIILCRNKEYEDALKKAIELLHEERENISNLECLRGILMYNEVDSGLSFFKGSREEGFNILTTLAKQGHKEAKEFIKEIKNQ